MPSTYLEYRLLAQNLPRTLARFERQAPVSREAEYYRANIGKVKSVDDFLADDRLFAYAMRAHGLEDKIGAKAFMRRVLVSDLSDARSFARSLVDTRYQAFARAFHFTTEGKVSEGLEAAQADAQEDETAGLYSEHRVRRGEKAATEVANYRSRIGLMTSVDEFLRDERLFSVALTAFGLEPRHASLATIRSVLTSDLSDPNSVANTLGDARYVALASAFGFQTDGSLPSGVHAQTDAQVEDTMERYFEATGNGASPAAASFRTEVYRAGIAALTSVDELLANDRLYEYALTAFDIDPLLTTKSDIRGVLLSDLGDPNSPANQRSERYQNLAAAFSFNADGTVASGGAQSAAQLESTVNGYFEHFNDDAELSDTALATYYRGRIGSITTVDELLSDRRLYSYVLDAFDFDPALISKGEIRRILLSDVSDPRSYANSRSDPRYRALAAAFNFAKDGTVTTALKAQTDNDELATITLYNTRVGTTAAEKERAKAENTYYHEAIGKLESIDELIADRRVVSYLLKAFGLEGENVSNDTLRRVLTSDPADPKSFARRLNDERYRDLAAAFNFTSDGKIKRAPEHQVQTRNETFETADLYLSQVLEKDAGAQNEGVRLALYFRRKAAGLNSAFGILADRALIEVVRTALNLPAQFSQIDIDAQAKFIEKRLKIQDLKDPLKLDRFLAQFAALYDVNNNRAAASSPAVLLSSAGAAGTGVDQGLLSSLQNVRPGRV
jgi:hypothetical protein